MDKKKPLNINDRLESKRAQVWPGAERFQDRKQAGNLLADKLGMTFDQDREKTIVLALPRGGVPVAFEISYMLNLPLDILVVRKIGHPHQPEYGIGAIAEEEFVWIDPEFRNCEEPLASQIQSVIESESKEIGRRVNLYRHNHALAPLEGKVVILVDDGLATGVTARVAAQFVRSKGASKIILAIPVCPQRTATSLRNEIDRVVCLNETQSFLSVGQFYQDFSQLSDAEVKGFISASQVS